MKYPIKLFLKIAIKLLVAITYIIANIIKICWHFDFKHLTSYNSVFTLFESSPISPYTGALTLLLWITGVITKINHPADMTGYLVFTLGIITWISTIIVAYEEN